MSQRQHSEPSALRAVIYARYSSDSQRDASIKDQVSICPERALREGWIVVNVFSDRAVCGAIALRPSYQAVLELARAPRDRRAACRGARPPVAR
jgi:hypothetical protein